jgi:hypothetical protein
LTWDNKRPAFYLRVFGEDAKHGGIGVFHSEDETANTNNNRGEEALEKIENAENWTAFGRTHILCGPVFGATSEPISAFLWDTRLAWWFPFRWREEILSYNKRTIDRAVGPF